MEVIVPHGCRPGTAESAERNGRPDTPIGGILLLSTALERHPNCGLILYNRMSSYSRAGPGLVKLKAATDARAAIRALAPDNPVCAVISGIEVG
jgi:hypothetical protein